MTLDNNDNGRTFLLIGVASVNPAEFVIIWISQKTTEPERAREHQEAAEASTLNL